MKLSTRARYALRMMVEIAKKTNGGETVSLSLVAKSSDLPRRYLEQLAIDLKKASLVTGVSGKGGGYILTRSPKKIRIGQIVEATIGPVNIVDCVLSPETCMRVDYCDCRLIYKRINERITEVLNDFSLADLAAGNVSDKELSPVSQESG